MPHGKSYTKRALTRLQGLDVWPWRLRRRLLLAAGLGISAKAFLEAGVEIVDGPLSIGDHSYVNRGCLLDARGGIVIGRSTLIGPRVTILTATHPVSLDRPRAGPVQFAPVEIGSGAWIGAGAILLPGSVVGDGTVVAAGAVVRGALDADTLYAGVPATARRSL